MRAGQSRPQPQHWCSWAVCHLWPLLQLACPGPCALLRQALCSSLCREARAVQVMVIPISKGAHDYAAEVRAQLRRAHLQVDVDLADKKMQKKVFEAQTAQYNYILVRLPLPRPSTQKHLGWPARSQRPLHAGWASA